MRIVGDKTVREQGSASYSVKSIWAEFGFELS